MPSAEQTKLVPAASSPSTVIDRLGYGYFQVLLFIAFSLFGLSLVLASGVTGFTIFIIDTNWEPSTAEVALFGSIIILAMGCGSFFSILLEPKFGRWTLVIGGQVGSLFFSLVSTFMPEFYSLMFTRFLAMTSVHISTSPGYSAFPEMIPSNYRGVFMSVGEFVANIGSITVWLYLHLFVPDLEGEGWRLMQLILCGMFTIPLILLCYYLIGESPLYLWQLNQPKKAIEALNRIAALNKQPGVTHQEAEAILHSRSTGPVKLVNVKQLFEGKYQGVGFILFWQWCVHTLCYLGVLSVYPYIIGGHDTEPSETLTSFLIYSIATFPAVIVLAFIIDKPGLGRRASMLILTFLSVVALIVPAIVMNDTLVLASLALFLAIEHSLIILMFIFTMEIFETALRNSAMAYYNLSSRVFVTGALYGIVFLADFSLRMTFFILGAMQVIALVSLMWLGYETKGILLDGDTIAEATKERYPDKP